MQSVFVYPKQLGKPCITIQKSNGIDQLRSLIIYNHIDEKLKGHLSNKLYGVGKKRNRYHLIYKLLDARINNKLDIIKFDLKSAFLTVNWQKTSKLLRKAGLEQDYFDEIGLSHRKIGICNSKKVHSGLPRGYNSSPIIYGLYISHFLKLINQYYETYLYVDDGYVLVPRRTKTEEVVRKLKKCLSKMGKCRHGPILNPHKGVWRTQANENIKILGIKLKGEISV